MLHRTWAAGWQDFSAKPRVGVLTWNMQVMTIVQRSCEDKVRYAGRVLRIMPGHSVYTETNTGDNNRNNRTGRVIYVY